MKNTMKKFLSLLLVAVMCITCLPLFYANAATTVQIPEDAVEFNGHYYKAYDISTSWTEAKSYCENLGGHLVTVTSQKEQTFIANTFLSNNPIKWFYLAGAFRVDIYTDQWHWITGEDFLYSNWSGDGIEASQIAEGQKYLWIISSSAPDTTTSELVDFKWLSHADTDYTTFWNTNNAGFICEWEPNEHTISGIKTGGSNMAKIAIDGVWYEYDTSIPGLEDAISRIPINKSITCKIRFGKIVACSDNPITTRTTVSINTANTIIEYDRAENKYSPEKITDLRVVITNELRGTNNTKNIAGYDITFDKIIINVQNGGMLYFKDGILNLGKTRVFEKTLDAPVTLKPGETYVYSSDQPVFADKDCEWSETELQKNVQISATFCNGEKEISSAFQTITFKNKTAQQVIEQNTQIANNVQQAADLLKNTTGILHDDYLEKLLGKDCLQEVTNVLKCKVAISSAVLKAKQNASLEDKLIEKLMKKANISKDWLGTVYTTNITHSVAGETKENGRFTVEFNIELSNISLGSGNNPFVSFSFDTTYEIKGGKKFETREGTVLSYFSYANIQTFADSVESVALEQIEYAYNLGYGNDLNKVCEMFFDDTITKILSKTKAESYSHAFYQSMVYPSKQAAIHCPVDVFVYDTQGNLCASIESNEITLDCEDMDIVVVGDEKYLTLYGEYEIEIVAFANDTMNITITEYASADDVLRTVAFNDLALLPGDSFVATVSEDYFFDEYQINKNEEEIITADSDESTIHSTQAVEIVDKQATCIEDGAYHVICEKCNMTVLSAVIPATGHADENQDGSCDACGEVLEQPEEPTDPEVPTEPDVPTDPETPDDPSDNATDCSCLCHSKDSFLQFIYTILRFLWQLFGMNMDCACGAKHFDSYFFG